MRGALELLQRITGIVPPVAPAHHSITVHEDGRLLLTLFLGDVVAPILLDDEECSRDAASVVRDLVALLESHPDDEVRASFQEMRWERAAEVDPATLQARREAVEDDEGAEAEADSADEPESIAAIAAEAAEGPAEVFSRADSETLVAAS